LSQNVTDLKTKGYLEIMSYVMKNIYRQPEYMTFEL